MAVRISRDPIAEKGGYNLYGMLSNNPINYWDGLGLESYFSTGGGEIQNQSYYTTGPIPQFPNIHADINASITGGEITLNQWVNLYFITPGFSIEIIADEVHASTTASITCCYKGVLLNFSLDVNVTHSKGTPSLGAIWIYTYTKKQKFKYKKEFNPCCVIKGVLEYELTYNIYLKKVSLFY